MDAAVLVRKVHMMCPLCDKVHEIYPRLILQDCWGGGRQRFQDMRVRLSRMRPMIQCFVSFGIILCRHWNF